MHEPLHLVLASESSAATRLRAEVRAWLLAEKINGTTGTEITSAVNEAFVNAVEHPRDRASDVITIDGKVGANEVIVRVSDDGRWNENIDTGRDHYGYELIEQLMDSVEVDRGPTGTSVTLRRRLRLL